jgi:hypothetical protein
VKKARITDPGFPCFLNQDLELATLQFETNSDLECSGWLRMKDAEETPKRPADSDGRLQKALRISDLLIVDPTKRRQQE